jgi:hypothetical protein
MQPFVAWLRRRRRLGDGHLMGHGVASSRLCRVNAAGVRCDATTPLPLHLSHDRLNIGE